MTYKRFGFDCFEDSAVWCCKMVLITFAAHIFGLGTYYMYLVNIICT